MYKYNSVKSKSVSFVRRDKLNHLMEDYAVFPIYWKYFKGKEVLLYVQMYEYKILLLNYFQKFTYFALFTSSSFIF